MLELWGMQNIPSFPLLFDPPCPRVVAPDRVLSIGQLFSVIARTLVEGDGSYSSAEMQTVYSTTPAD